MKKAAFSLLLLTAFFCAAHGDVDSQIRDKQKELLEIEKQLEKSEEQFKQFGKEEGSILTTLGEIRDKISRVSKEKSKASRNMKKLEKEVSLLSSDIDDLEEKQGRIKKVLGAVIYNSFVSRKSSGAGPSLTTAVAAGRKDTLLGQIGSFNYYILTENARTLELTTGKIQKKSRSYEKYRLSYLDRKIAEKKLASLERRQKSALNSIQSKKEYYDRLIRELKERKEELNGLIKTLEKKGSRYQSGVKFSQLKGALIWPAQGSVYSKFGRQVDKTYKTVTSNDGIDIRTSPGAGVKAVAGGRVVFAQNYKSMGMMVVIDHGSSYYTVYWNMSSITVRDGQVVTAGQHIGATARDALSGMPSLHFEIRKGASAVSPEEWLSKS